MDDDELERMLEASRPAGLVLKNLHPEPRTDAHALVKLIDARISGIVAPTVAEFIRELRAESERLKQRLQAMEARIDALAGPRRVA